MKRKLMAALLLVAMIVPLFSFTAFAASGQKKIKSAKIVTSLGDSASSGFGLPDYNRHKKQILYGERIRDSYPDLVTRALGARTLHPYGISGIRTYDLRFLLDNNFKADYILKDVMGYMSDYVITEKHLKELRPAYQKAVKESDVILLDVGFDDIWIPTIACVYDIAEDGRFNKTEPRSQYRNDRYRHARQHLCLCTADRSFDLDFFKLEITRSFESHQQSDLVDQFAEILCVGVLVSEKRHFVLDQRMIKYVYFSHVVPPCFFAGLIVVLCGCSANDPQLLTSHPASSRDVRVCRLQILYCTI